jgi:hypothetical protein
MSTVLNPQEKTMITELILLKLAETLARKQRWIRSAPTLGKLLAESPTAHFPVGSPKYPQVSGDDSAISPVSSSLPLPSDNQ